jgi:ABC-2 type transport system permease protein
MMRTLLFKEWREQWRTWRGVILVAVLVISGLISPLLAYYTPVLLRSVPGMPPGFADLIPDPTVADAIGQYLKNVSQFGVLLIVILSMGSVAQEIERGTAAMLLARPVRRSALVLSKWLVWSAVLALGLALSAFLDAVYTWILFEPLPFLEFVQLNLLLFVFFNVFLSVSLLASSLARTQAVAAGAAFGGLALLLVLGSLPRLGDFMPNQLNAWGVALMLGNPDSAWGALWVSLGIIIAALVAACWRLEKEEI